MSTENVPVTAATETDSGRAPGTDVAPEKTVDVVRRAREARAKDAPPAKAVTPPAPEPPGDGGESAPTGDKPGADAPPAKKSTEDLPAGTFIPDEELIGKDLRNVDLSKVRPELRETVRKMQTAERKKHEEFNSRLKQLDDMLKKAESRVPALPESEEDDDLPLSKTELAALLKSKNGRETIKELLRDEIGDLDELKASAEDRIMARAVTTASERYPELKDEAFFRETVELIAEDADLAAEFDESEANPTRLARVIRSAAAEVRSRRKDAEASTLAQKAKDADDAMAKLKREREEIGMKPGSVAAKAGRTSTKTPDAELSTLDMVKRIKAERGYA